MSFTPPLTPPDSDQEYAYNNKFAANTSTPNCINLVKKYQQRNLLAKFPNLVKDVRFNNNPVVFSPKENYYDSPESSESEVKKNGEGEITPPFTAPSTKSSNNSTPLSILSEDKPIKDFQFPK